LFASVLCVNIIEVQNVTIFFMLRSMKIYTRKSEQKLIDNR
jgi:hypothetical protein